MIEQRYTDQQQKPGRAMPNIQRFALSAVFFGTLLTGAGCSQHSNTDTALTAQNSSAATMVEQLANGQFDQLGHIQIATDKISPVRAKAERPHQLLVLPVAFSDVSFERHSGATEADKLNRDYFQQALFGRDDSGYYSPGTLPHYYLQQSQGRYHIDGHVLPVVELPHSLAEFGRPLRNSDGSWRNDSKPSRMVTAAIQAAFAAQPDYDWQQHDIWDPTDFDGDGNRNEADGYLDHLIVVYAGKAQSSCHGLYKLADRFTSRQDETVFDTLSPAELACANRVWPHRSSITENLAAGPTIGGRQHQRGGVQLSETLWLYDYNMQSEYTDVSTFIHEFGHSIGLPDLYASRTNNSTASWDLMSSTSSPQPQALSSWSRMMLGWLEPCVVRPPEFGGAQQGAVEQHVMNLPAPLASESCAATMVILPPKIRELNLGPLAPSHGSQAVYSGQGNDLQRSLTREFDFTGQSASSAPLTLSFDAWFDIEADWDYLYIEAAAAGESFTRLLPIDRSDSQPGSVMPSKQGHEGSGSLPGLTGRSGDLDGDGRVESNPGCDLSAERPTSAEQIDSGQIDLCTEPTWITAEFDLEAWRGRTVRLRWHYFTDGAAVNDGALIDNIRVDAVQFFENFEQSNALAAESGWVNNAFSLSGGQHRLTVPHYLLLEYRDPYADFGLALNYDANLAKHGLLFYPEEERTEPSFKATTINYRPGLLAWYYNGEYLWSQNEPSQNGPGKGFLLLLDSTAQEFTLPGLESELKQDDNGWNFYQFDPEQQPLLKQRYVETACFLRRADYFPSELRDQYRELCGSSAAPSVETVTYQGRSLRYGYTIINELLPGTARQQLKAASSFYDMQPRAGVPFYRLYDRLLRNRHSADAPFALEPFEAGRITWQIDDQKRVVEQSRSPFAPVAEFDGRSPERYINPNLPFGSVALPALPFSFKLRQPNSDIAPNAAIGIEYQWHRE